MPRALILRARLARHRRVRRDAAAYGDAGADTLGHIAEACAAGGAIGPACARAPAFPNLVRSGSARRRRPRPAGLPPGLEGSRRPGHGALRSSARAARIRRPAIGRLPACPVDFDWGYFPDTVPCFPPDLVDAIVAEADMPGVLARRTPPAPYHRRARVESIATGKPIVYTSADSVLQIAAHEEAFGLDRLFGLCAIARRHCRRAQHRAGDRAPLRRHAPDGFRAHREPPRLRRAAAERHLLDRLARGGPRDHLGRQDRRYLRASGDGRDRQGRRQHGARRRDARGVAALARRAAWSSPISSTSTRFTGIGATCRLCAALEAFDARYRICWRAAAPGRHHGLHGRSWLRPDLRPAPTTRASMFRCLRPAGAATRRDRPAQTLRRHRRDDRRPSEVGPLSCGTSFAGS